MNIYIDIDKGAIDITILLQHDKFSTINMIIG